MIWKNIFLKPVKWIICDFLRIHLYTVYAGSYSLESDRDGNYREEIYFCCIFCGKDKEVINIKRDKILDEKCFKDLLKDYIDLIRNGVQVSEYGLFSSNYSYSSEIEKKIDSFRYKYLTVSAKYGRFSLSRILYIEAQKAELFKDELYNS